MTAYMNRNQITTINYNRENIIEAYYNHKKVFGAVTPPGDTYFYASDDFQEYVVPENVNKIHVECFASRGQTSQGFSGWNGSMNAGKGGKVECDLSVTPNQHLYIMVGGIPSDPRTPSYNASDIRTDNTGITDETSLQSRLIVAGGGGNGATTSAQHYNNGTQYGGGGGGLTGGTSTGYYPATGGSQTEGGISSTGNTNTRGQFGLGGNRVDSYPYYSQNGAGGAGYYGGGGGQSGDYISGHAHAFCTAAGGGSSYTDPNLCTNVVHTQGINEGEGYIIIKRPDVTLTINPTPADATVTLSASEYTQSGNSITVKAGTSVNYTVSKSGYETISDSIVVNETVSIDVILKQEALWYCYVANETSSYPYIWYFSTKPVTPSGVLKDYYYKSHYRYATSSSQLNETHNYSGMHDITDDSFIDGQGDVFYYKPEYNLYT